MVSSTKALRVSPAVYDYLRKRYFELREKSQISLSFLKLSNLVAEAGVESLKRLTDDEIIPLIKVDKKKGLGRCDVGLGVDVGKEVDARDV
ncbi:MAG: hypothetical protein QW175_07230 [Candidatus Bathyarchaeia archaeon]